MSGTSQRNRERNGGNAGGNAGERCESELIIRGGTIVTVDPLWRIEAGDLVCRDGVIAQVGGDAVPVAREYEVLDASGCFVLPGLVQSHVHTCQTLARGRGDGLSLLDWLRRVTWPYEATLDAGDVEAAARLACVELLLGGTTAIQDMGTVRHTEAIFAVVNEAGIRAAVGKVLMDAAEGFPAALREKTSDALEESEALCKAWHGKSDGRLRYAYAPRFALSCSAELLEGVAAEARRLGARIHTHASESPSECQLVRERTGVSNIAYLDSLGLLGPDVGLAHCVWLEGDDLQRLAETGTRVLHCPSANLKLGSGIAKVPEMLAANVHVSLGADGAPCNDNLDAFVEMRLAGLLPKPRLGAAALPARDVVRMATMGGAQALGLEEQIGSLEVGKQADVTVVSFVEPHVVPAESPYAALVYSCRAADVRHVVVAGRALVRDRELSTLDVGRVVSNARARARRIFDRI
ncbi:MAG: 5'-deoxyadenosine deaminase [Pseudomonadota bacterium]